jgi:hypothetical protein
MEVSGQLYAPAALSSDTHWIGGWVGLRIYLYFSEKWKTLTTYWNQTTLLLLNIL